MTDHPIVIVGAGFGGIAMAVKLRAAGIRDFVILERADEVGGTWRDNRYPGCACDVASNLYSLSFAPNPNWTATYGTQPEIFGYVKQVARDFDVLPHVRFNTALDEARWDADEQHWRLETSAGPMTAQILISAGGPFGAPQLPEIPGLDDFAGTQFHTARWDHDHDLRGRRVAIIGTGATAAQVIPAIQSEVSHLSVFQRTPTWVLPRLDSPTSAVRRALYRRLPLIQRGLRGGWYAAYESLVGLPQYVHPAFLEPFEAWGRWHLRRQISDPAMREQLTPNFRFGCKRMILSDTYYPALAQPNVDLVTASIERIEADAVVTTDGHRHEVDTLILATGFRVPHEIYDRYIGVNGRRLGSLLSEQSRSWLGTSVDGYPNLFTMLGPFSASGNQSAIFMLETQADYITRAIKQMRRRGLQSVEARPDAVDGFTEEVARRSRNTSWVSGGCQSYYQSADGGNAGLWPHWSFMYRWRTRRFDVRKFVVNGEQA